MPGLPLLVAAVLTACQGAATPAPSTPAGPSTPPAANPSASTSASASAAAAIDLFDTAYKPDAGTDGGQ